MQISLKKFGQIFFPTDIIGKDAIESLKNGEYNCKITKQRNGKFHRKYFALLNFAFENWHTDDDDFKNFDVFRKNIAVLSGYYDQAYGLKGKLQLVAKSISFSKMDEVEFADLYSKSVQVILTHVLTNYTEQDLDRVVAEIIGFD